MAIKQNILTIFLFVDQVNEKCIIILIRYLDSKQDFFPDINHYIFLWVVV